MGMSNEQFDSYKTQLLRNLQHAQKEVKEKGQSQTLDQIISDLESELKKPYLEEMQMSNKTNCPCTRVECERHGNCEACKESHHNRGYLRACARPKDADGNSIMPVLGNYLVTQVAIIVRDIEVTKQKFAAFFGVEPPATIQPGDFSVTQTTYMGNPAPNAKCKLAFFNAGPNVALELIEPNGEQSTWQDFLDTKGEGIHHIAFGVSGMDDKVAACEQLGMICTQRGKYGDGNGEYAYIDATADLKCFIELLESYPQG